MRILRKVGRLPSRARAAGLALLVAATAPAAAALAGAVLEPVPRATLAEHRHLLAGLELCLAVAAVVGFHPPRSASPLAYARQLRARFLELQSTFDADDRRRPGEGKEKEDDHVPSEP